ncbi:MAG TPA: HAMP domain-containing sensor histidine kinase [Pantanalinema sp.]
MPSNDPSAFHLPATEPGTTPDRFLNTVSHGLRSPLMAINVAAQLLSLEATGSLTDAQRRHVERIRTSSLDMHDRVSDLLELSLHHARRVVLHVRPLDLDACAAEAIASIRPQASARGVEVRHAPSTGPSGCMGDAARITHLLRNLLANAVRFTPSGGHVRVSTAPDGPWLRCRVEDTGCGIAPDALETLFEPFYLGREECGDRLGIGLNVCKAILDLHGGTLSVESRLGAGSVFSFTLPRS